MDPTTASAIHPASLHTSTSPDGTPILSTAPPTTNPFTTGSTNLAAPKSDAPPSDPIAGLSGPNSVQSSSAKSTSSASTTPAATGIRQRASALTDAAASATHSAAEHPAVQDIKHTAEKQVQSARERLGKFPLLVDIEKRTGVDRVILVVGGVFLYLILIPLNLLGLALPTTQLLTFLPPTLLAIRTLDNPNEERTKTLLSYFVVFGFVQFAESLMAGFLEKRIPQYYTVKLLFLAYLIHPRTKGARKFHASVLRPLLVKTQQHSSSSHANARSQLSGKTSTPPSASARSSDSAYTSTHASPSAPAFSLNSEVRETVPPVPSIGGASEVNAPLSRAGGFTGTGPNA